MPQYYGRAGGIPTRKLTQKVIKDWWQRYGKIPDAQVRQQYFGLAAANEALQYMDPTTRAQYMQQLARDMPGVFSGYAGTQLVEPVTGRQTAGYTGELLGKQRLAEAIQGLSAAKILKQLGQGYGRKDIENYLKSEAGVPLGFLQEYLQTAYQGYGTGIDRATRAQQAQAQARLKELEAMAERDQRYGSMLNLGRAIVNPAIGRRPASGLVGTGRATSGMPGPRRGGIARQPWLT